MTSRLSHSGTTEKQGYFELILSPAHFAATPSRQYVLPLPPSTHSRCSPSRSSPLQALDNNDGTYSVTFTPSDPSKTECFVVVLIDDEELEGSPFRCVVAGTAKAKKRHVPPQIAHI